MPVYSKLTFIKEKKKISFLVFINRGSNKNYVFFSQLHFFVNSTALGQCSRIIGNTVHYYSVGYK